MQLQLEINKQDFYFDQRGLIFLLTAKIKDLFLNKFDAIELAPSTSVSFRTVNI